MFSAYITGVRLSSFCAPCKNPTSLSTSLGKSHSRCSGGKGDKARLRHSRDGVRFEHIHFAFTKNHVRSAPVPALKRSVSSHGASLDLLGLSWRNPCRANLTRGSWSVLCLVIKKGVFRIGDDFDNRERLKGVVSQDTAGQLLAVEEPLHQDFLIMVKRGLDTFDQLLLGVTNRDSDARSL